MAGVEDPEDFMDSPLVLWVKTCVGNPDMKLYYNDLVDGVVLYQILLQIDPEPAFSGVTSSQGNILMRIRNLEAVLSNLRNLYKEELNQLVITVPNVVRLGTECDTPAAKQDLRLLILLLLACAVQCPNKEHFIEKIKEMPLDIQHLIVHHIKQFTDTPEMVLPVEHEGSVSNHILLNHVKQLVKERDELLSGWAGAATAENNPPEKLSSSLSQSSNSETHHLAVELADWKSKLRRQRQELEEKTEALNECKDELELQRSAVARLRQEVADVVQDARSAKAYRDELDIVRERAERADKLEVELERYKAKIRDVEFFKTRVEELRDDNRVLIETREMLEGQLERARKRGDRVVDLDAEILKLKQENNELSLERDAKDRKLEEQYAEIAELRLARCSQAVDTEQQKLFSEANDSAENSLSTQLSNNATTRAYKLELENHRLRLAMDNLKESAVHEANAKLLDSEHQNKLMAIKVEQLEEQCNRLTSENQELEELVKDASQDLRKMQESRETLRSAVDNQQVEIQATREKAEKVQIQLDHQIELYTKAVSQLKELENEKNEIADWREKASMVPDMKFELEEKQKRLDGSEALVQTLQKDINRLKQAIEENHSKMDEMHLKADVMAKEKEQMAEEMKASRAAVARVHDLEIERDGANARTQVSQQALQTLQNELVQLKVDYQNLQSSVLRLGLHPDMLVDPNVTLASLLSMPELKDQLPLELRQNCQQCTEIPKLREEIALQQVKVSTLQSQLNSLSAQHTAVQLANTQLAAEKEQLEEERRQERAEYDRLLQDQTSLQRLHEQLSSEHDTMIHKQEALRDQVRSQQREIQALKEDSGRHKAAQEIAQSISKELNEKTTSLKNLRDEHSKLKGDFRELFTSSMHFKTEFKQVADEYKRVKTEANNLLKQNSELREKLMATTDNVRTLEMHIERLVQANQTLEEDRRSVMDHATVLLAQYQELFTHSIEDHQHFHDEEREFMVKVNELRRQKEKLEEKIMDHYRRSDSTPNKKKGITATLMRRVRKAGSDLVNRSRRSLHEDSRGSMNIPGSESGENESDTSYDDGRHDETGPLPRILKQQGAGTRQTVYEADGDASTNPTGQPTSLLVINQVNATTIVGQRPTSPSLSLRSQPAEDPRRKTKKSDVYFDYGCV